MAERLPVRTNLLALFGLLAMAGCGALFNSSKRSVAMSSTPSEAEVYIDGNRAGTTPLTLELDNQEKHAVTFKKAGYQDVTCTIGTTVGAGYVVLDILGGLVPIIIDAATGKWKSLDTEACNVNLPSN